MGSQASSVMTDLVHDLRKRIAGEVRFDQMTKVLYSTDASIYEIEPLGVVFPKTPEDAIATVEICGRYGVPILPRGADAQAPVRVSNTKVNELIAACDDGGQTVKFLDVAGKFVDADGKPLAGAYQNDNTHLTHKGYEILAEAMLPAVKALTAPAEAK